MEDEKNGEGKGGKCLEKINIWLVEAKKNGEGNVRNYLEKTIFGQWRRRRMEKEKEVNIRQKDKLLRTNEGSFKVPRGPKQFHYSSQPLNQDPFISYAFSKD